MLIQDHLVNKLLDTFNSPAFSINGSLGRWQFLSLLKLGKKKSVLKILWLSLANILYTVTEDTVKRV